jgi:hypothetical protein
MTTGKLQLLPLSQPRYQLVSSNNTLMHTIYVNMSALSHCQVGDKHETRDDRDLKMSNLTQLLGSSNMLSQFAHLCTDWRTVMKRCKKPRWVAVQFSNDDMAHIAVQLQPNDMVQ